MTAGTLRAMQEELDRRLPVIQFSVGVTKDEINLSDSSCSLLNLQPTGHDLDATNLSQPEKHETLEVPSDSMAGTFCEERRQPTCIDVVNAKRFLQARQFID